MRLRSTLILLPPALWLASGCATLLGVDGEYEKIETAGGARATGGMSPNGGAPPAMSGGRSGEGGLASGGAPLSSGGLRDGGLGAGGASVPPPDGDAPCPQGEKRCTVEGSSLCVSPDPSVGCGLTGCDQCGAPSGGFPLCSGVDCDFGCYEGFVRNGAACDAVPPPDGGRGGATGSGGAPTTCTRDADCPRCGPAAGCCTLVPSGKCGCNFVWCVPSQL